jgi:CheY-like chemotaxis protein
MDNPDPASGIVPGLKVFVVEDEAMIAMMLEDILLDMGCTVLGPSFGIDQAIALIESGDHPDVAILDVNVAGQTVYPVAELLAARGVPLIFATGYGSVGLAEAWRSRITVQKPYAQDDIERALRAALATAD